MEAQKAWKGQLEQLKLKLQVQAEKLSDSETLAQSILPDSSRKICSNKITLGNREQSTRGEQIRNLAFTPRPELTVSCFSLLDSQMEWKYVSSKYHWGIRACILIPIFKYSAEMTQL